MALRTPLNPEFKQSVLNDSIHAIDRVPTVSEHAKMLKLAACELGFAKKRSKPEIFASHRASAALHTGIAA